jgi:hypothetical protein
MAQDKKKQGHRQEMGSLLLYTLTVGKSSCCGARSENTQGRPAFAGRPYMIDTWRKNA